MVFYYNPDESRLFVAKKSGLPLTLNFAKPVAWAITALTLAIGAIVGIINNIHSVR